VHPSSILTVVTSLAVPLAALLLVVSVLWSAAARRVDLVAVVLALVGAIAARVAVSATGAGDPVFRAATAPWAAGLALVAAGWWLLFSPGARGPGSRGVRTVAGVLAVGVALGAAATSLGHPPTALVAGA